MLLSKSTAALIEDTLIEGMSLRDLGAYRLKGLPRPERIFQLIIPDLPADFPPLQSLDTRGRPDLAPGRVVTPVLFVDWVGATARLVALGDRPWLELRAQYTALVRLELARHGGEERTWLATRSSPSSTVQPPPSAAGARSEMACRNSVWR